MLDMNAGRCYNEDMENRLPKDALPIQYAAARYNVARRTLDRWAAAGKLPVYHAGRGDTRIYVRASVVEWLLTEPVAPRGRPGAWRNRNAVPEEAVR